ncbi:CBS domain-containing protein [Streptococcus pneumoniae]|uniref:CBS domain-containing protein n=1 Tax=Streptococcus pneumoniae TaxID=1313 RepID=UPI00061C94EA|nr:CBS domain-containing protein [Streptococcus pneumoniae]CKI90692.1 CBS domain containing protein [Streptococcus pneumoniae]VIU55102.1 CBS domain containing protein [Streptococcus pneumoniae]
MAVKDFMTRKVVYISPDTTVSHAADLMREQELHRLPVIENDQLVGLVTEGTIAQASPSKATSLSIYEMNYLLNKTKVKDVMIRDVVTVSGYASLEDATYLMLKNKIGILPVVDNHQVYGVITDRDVFQAFLEIAGYGEEGIRVRFVTEDEVGVLGKIVSLIVEENLKQMVFKWKKSLALQQKSCKKGSPKASFFMKRGLEQKMERNDKICYNEIM